MARPGGNRSDPRRCAVLRSLHDVCRAKNRCLRSGPSRAQPGRTLWTFPSDRRRHQDLSQRATHPRPRLYGTVFPGASFQLDHRHVRTGRHALWTRSNGLQRRIPIRRCSRDRYRHPDDARDQLPVGLWDHHRWMGLEQQVLHLRCDPLLRPVHQLRDSARALDPRGHRDYRFAEHRKNRRSPIRESSGLERLLATRCHAGVLHRSVG